MSASSLSTLTPGAFRSLIGAVSSALRPATPPCDQQPCHERRTAQASRCHWDRCDVVDCCGLLFNEALREIHRLRSGLDGCEEPRLAVRPCSEQTPACETRRTLASPPNDRLPYAVPALGDVQPHQRERLPIILPQHITRKPVITNLGTLLDVLI